MSKFLHVYGGDYSAMDFEENYNVQEFYQEMIRDGLTKKIIDEEDYYIEVKIKEFGEVDNNFVNFIQNELCDYDGLKSENIYKID